MKKPILGVYYWHNPTRMGVLEMVNKLRNEFYVVLIANEDIRYLEGYCDDIIVFPFSDPKGLQKILLEYKSKNGLDGTITLSEGAVTLNSDIGKELGLIVNSTEYSRFGRNKYFMRELFKKLEIPSPKYFQIHDLNEAERIFTQEFAGKRAFLKPPCIGGSSFCVLIDDINILKRDWNYFFTESFERTKKDPLFHEMFQGRLENYYLLLEEVLGGTHFHYDSVLGQNFPVFEMSVEGFINGSETYVYSMTDKLLPLSGVKNGEEYMWRMHSRIPGELKKVLTERVNKINRGLGAICGCSHTEFRIEETTKEFSDIEFNGKYYVARVIETALRIGGAFMQPAIYECTGFNSVRAMAQQACGLSITEEVLYRKPGIVINLWANSVGNVKGYSGLDKIFSYKEKLKAMNLYDTLGDNVLMPPEANRGSGDAFFIDADFNLNNIKDWEILDGKNSPYFAIETIFLEIYNNFKIVTN